MSKFFTVMYLLAHIVKWPTILIAACIGLTGGFLSGIFSALITWLIFKTTTFALFICAGASLAMEEE